jgi:hypothetical protein
MTLLLLYVNSLQSGSVLSTSGAVIYRMDLIRIIRTSRVLPCIVPNLYQQVCWRKKNEGTMYSLSRFAYSRLV